MSDPLAPRLSHLPPPPPTTASGSPKRAPQAGRGRRAGSRSCSRSWPAATVFALTRGDTSPRPSRSRCPSRQGQTQTYAIHQTMDAPGLAPTCSATAAADGHHAGRRLEGDLGRRGRRRPRSRSAVSEMSRDAERDARSRRRRPRCRRSRSRSRPTAGCCRPAGSRSGARARPRASGSRAWGSSRRSCRTTARRSRPATRWDKDFSQDFPFGDGDDRVHGHEHLRPQRDRERRRGRRDRDEDDGPDGLHAGLHRTCSTRWAGDLGATGADGPRRARRTRRSPTRGQGTFTQTSFVDLAAKELLKSAELRRLRHLDGRSPASPGFEGGIAFTGTFTQGLELR